jgi:hypothetical protein
MKDLLTLLNNYFPGCYYSIMDIDAYMPEAKLSDGAPAFEQIDLAIRNFSTGFTVNFNVLFMIASQFNDVKDLFIVINHFKKELAPYNVESCRKYINNSFVQIVIEDLTLIEVVCKEKYLEETIKHKLGLFPIRITCDN